jgi:hydroxymethylbilane synthase
VTLRLGTRGSALALAQSGLIADALRARAGVEIELVPITTSGDERKGGATPELGDKSRFVKEIEEALLAGDIDVAVHSAKDVPGSIPDGLSIVAVPERADARDVVCGADSLSELPEGARVGTSSLRRQSLLRALRPDLQVAELRGNVDTRLRKLSENQYDAIILAKAGLDRLGRSEGMPVAPEALTPAPGQGCLALEARSDDARVAEIAAPLNHEDSLARLAAERAVVLVLEATCHTPVGAYAEMIDGQMRLQAYVGLPDGSEWIRDELTGPADEPAELGVQVAERLIAAGARDILAAAEAQAA